MDARFVWAQPRARGFRITVPALLSLAACSLSLWTHGAEPPAALVLVQDGQPRATIVLAEKPTASAQLAAYELQYHVRRMSGATLPIVREPQAVTGTVVLVGESDATRALGYRSSDFQPSEYLIEAAANRLVLIGATTTGVWRCATTVTCGR